MEIAFSGVSLHGAEFVAVCCGGEFGGGAFSGVVYVEGMLGGFFLCGLFMAGGRKGN